MKSVIGGTTTRQVAFVGPFGVGKTTAVCTISESSVATTDVASTAMMLRAGRHLKTTTTVGLEIGQWQAPDGSMVSIVGTPGQERFDMVRKSAMPRSQGVVLWLYGHHEHALLDTELWLEFIANEVPTHKLTVALTRFDGSQAPLEDFREAVDQVDPAIPLLLADPRERDDVDQVLRTSLRIPQVMEVVS
ncbi:MAG: hypothetical protein QM714_16540 [Nocardioides sp.]|uniref:GTP-binding protein n=1 Tax=Nocardioides sp. TaxID=35761 RepID=UPI0039E51B70